MEPPGKPGRRRDIIEQAGIAPALRGEIEGLRDRQKKRLRLATLAGDVESEALAGELKALQLQIGGSAGFLHDDGLEISRRAAIRPIHGILFPGAWLRWAVRAEYEPTATKGGDPSGTYKRWFGRVSGRAGWHRGSPLVGTTSCWPGGHRGMRAGLLSRARPGPTDGRSDAVAVRMTLVRTP